MPDSIKQQISCSEWRTTETGEEPFWKAPISVTVQQVEDAWAYVQAVQRIRPEIQKTALRDYLAALLVNFFHASAGEKVNALVASFWIEVIAPFPEPVVKAAVKRWLETIEKKPTPAAFRNLCIELYGWKAWQDFDRARKMADMLPTMNPSLPYSEQEEVWEKPTLTQKQEVSVRLHEAGFHTARKGDGCPLCSGVAVCP